LNDLKNVKSRNFTAESREEDSKIDKKVSSSNCMGKSKFRIFAENIKIFPSLKNNNNRGIIL
jgi:hypothetical protein